MFLKDETRYPPQKNLRIATSPKLTGGFTTPSTPITGNYWAEGPTATKIGDQWIVYFDKYTEHKYGAVVQMPHGIRHGTVFKITKEELAVLLK